MHAVPDAPPGRVPAAASSRSLLPNPTLPHGCIETCNTQAYYFGADAGIFGTTHQLPELMFRTELSGLTYFQREDGWERLSVSTL